MLRKFLLSLPTAAISALSLPLLSIWLALSLPLALSSCRRDEPPAPPSDGTDTAPVTSHVPPAETEPPPSSESVSSEETEAETDSHPHIWEDWTTTAAPTCIAAGQRVRLCACGARDTETIPATGHRDTQWIVDKEATLREVGRKHQICLTCNTSLNLAIIPIPTITRLPGILDKTAHRLRPHFELANCRRLEGSPVVVLIFLDDDQSRWTAEEASAFTEEEITPALDYLEKEAERWKVPLSFTVECYSTPVNGYEIQYEGVVTRNLDRDGSTKDALDQVAADIGCDSGWDLYSYYKSKYPDDDIIFLCLLNASGKSYTRHSVSTGYLEYAEHSILFADSYGAPAGSRKEGSRAAVVAHEILHLFGAEDYYTSLSRERLAMELYPDDIMLWQYDDIQSNALGDCTAYSVGWTDKAPSVCYNSKWWQ